VIGEKPTADDGEKEKGLGCRNGASWGFATDCNRL